MDDKDNKQVLQDKIDRLNKQAWEGRVNDSTRAHVLSKKAIGLAETINYTKGKAEGYRTFGFSLIRLSRHHEALEYCEKSLALFESLNDLDGQSSVYAYYGIIQRSLGNYAASLEFLFKFLELTQQTGNKESEMGCYYHLGITYKYLGDNETALNYLLQTLSARQPQFIITSGIAEAACLKQIGLIYFETGDLNNALGYNHQSLILMQQAGDKWGEAGCLDSIGFIYFKLRDFDKALSFCSQALSISEVIDDKKGKSNALFHIGNIYNELADYNEASDYGDRCLLIRRDIGDKKGEAEILLFLSGIYIKENFREQSSQRAFDLLNRALQLGQEIKAVDLLSKIHLSYYEACKHFNRFEEALSHIETHMTLAKTIHSDAMYQKIQNLEISHKVEKSKKEAELYRLRNVELLLENQQIVEVERNRLAKDLHDGLGGLLSGIKLTLGGITGNMVLQGENAAIFSRALSQLDNTISEMRRVAHSMMPETLLRFGLSEAIRDYCDGINESNTIRIKFTQIGLPLQLEQSTQVILYRIIQELTNNAIKHAAPKNIFVQLNRHEQGLTLTVEDDGPGFDAARVTKGAGFQNVQSRVDYLKG